MYKIDFLIKTFTKHAEVACDNWLKDRRNFKKMNPKEPLPDYLKDDFNLPLALVTICHAIRDLQEEPQEKVDGK
jgi:hypothetical protein